MQDDCDFEHSQLSGRFTMDNITVEVEIYRIIDADEPWRLEVVNEYGRCTRWHERFATEWEAYQTFLAVVEADGISFFDGIEGRTRH